MKVIFLDIDGVLNSTQYWESIQDEKRTMPEMEFEYNEILDMLQAKRYTDIRSFLESKNPADIAYQRIFSRLLEMCLPVECNGEDRRRKILM